MIVNVTTKYLIGEWIFHEDSKDRKFRFSRMLEVIINVTFETPRGIFRKFLEVIV